MIRFRKALARDIDSVERIYGAVHAQEESGRITIGWQRGVYPVRETAEKALALGELYVAEIDDTVVAAAKINRTQEEAYRAVPWRYPALDSEVLVLHTLVVDPACSGRGVGKAFVAYYEETARQTASRALRIDTNARNSVARALYAKLGFRESGIIPTVFNGIEGVQLVCLEKAVPESEA